MSSPRLYLALFPLILACSGCSGDEPPQPADAMPADAAADAAADADRPADAGPGPDGRPAEAGIAPDAAPLDAASTDTQPPPETSVLTTQGWVEGHHSADKQAVIFKGIPYARPPVGADRFREPAPHPGWTTPRVADAYSKACPQNGTLVAPKDQSEDCLTVNVFKTSGVTKAPVLVYIHGGGFTLGSSRLPIYDGEHWGKQGIVFVSFNYRVGILGFYSHAALAGDGRKVGNYGLRDQLLALKWIKANAAAFGGDPDRITIMGSSAGGASVSYWVASSTSAAVPPGLFHRAIIQSGGGSGADTLIHHRDQKMPFNNFAPGFDRGDKMLRDVFDGTGYGPLPTCASQFSDFDQLDDACKLQMLLSLSVKDLLATPLGQIQTQPYIDDDLVTQHFMRTFEQGGQRDVPLIVGSNGWEASVAEAAIAAQPTKYYYGLDPAELKDVYKICNDPLLLAERVYGDKTFGVPARRLARLHATSKSQPAYLYYFNYVTEGLRTKYPKGTPHPFLNPLTFHTYFYMQALRDVYPDPGPTDHKIAAAYRDYWLDFVKRPAVAGGLSSGPLSSGPLSSGPHPAWPAYVPAQNELLFVNKVGTISLQQDLLAVRFDYIEHELLDPTYPLPSWTDHCP